MSVSLDFKDLLRLFNAYRVKYLIIGGYAVIKYTEPRYTKDLETSPHSQEEILTAPKAFAAIPAQRSVESVSA